MLSYSHTTTNTNTNTNTTTATATGTVSAGVSTGPHAQFRVTYVSTIISFITRALLTIYNYIKDVTISCVGNIIFITMKLIPAVCTVSSRKFLSLCFPSSHQSFRRKRTDVQTPLQRVVDTDVRTDTNVFIKGSDALNLATKTVGQNKIEKENSMTEGRRDSEVNQKEGGERGGIEVNNNAMQSSSSSSLPLPLPPIPDPYRDVMLTSVYGGSNKSTIQETNPFNARNSNINEIKSMSMNKNINVNVNQNGNMSKNVNKNIDRNEHNNKDQVNQYLEENLEQNNVEKAGEIEVQNRIIIMERTPEECILKSVRTKGSELLKIYAGPMKVSLAVTITSLFLLVNQLQSAYQNSLWAILVVILIRQENTSSSFLTGYQRLEGTVIGAVYAFTMFQIFNCANDVCGVSVSTPVLVIWLAFCAFFRDGPRHGYAALVAGFTPIVLFLGPTPSTSEGAWQRVEQTWLGVGIYLLIDNLILPNRTDVALRAGVLESIHETRYRTYTP